MPVAVLGLATTGIAAILIAVIVVGWLVYAFLNTSAARRELGSEVELAPNRRPYYDDEALEGRRLELVQLLGLLLLIVSVVGLPLYWIFEPSRQAGAERGLENRLAHWGSLLFAPTGDNASAFNCAGCHGGMNATGGAADYAVTDPTTGEVTSVKWKAPALNTVFYRYDVDEVRYIITYGRPFSPMSPWGLDGGGPMNTQQIDSLLAYLASIQIPREECGPDDLGEPEDPIADVTLNPLGVELAFSCESGHLPADIQDDIEKLARQTVEDGTYDSYGEALFNLDLSSGAYSCARCHTQGWSYDDPAQPGQGALGWNLTGGSENAHFPNQSDMLDFVGNGSENGVRYGRQSQGSGRMPGFGKLLTDEQIEAIIEYVRSL